MIDTKAVAYLARKTALRSCFAASAMRGSTRAALQLRSIWNSKKAYVLAQQLEEQTNLLEDKIRIANYLPFLCSYPQIRR